MICFMTPNRCRLFCVFFNCGIALPSSKHHYDEVATSLCVCKTSLRRSRNITLRLQNITATKSQHHLPQGKLLLPFYRCRRFGSYIVNHPVYVFDFVYYARRYLLQNMVRNIRPIGSHTVYACNGA